MYEIIGVKKTILEATKKIAVENGIASISIRAVATKCAISVGTVYNHYPEKSDLIAAVISDFWQGAFTCVDFHSLFELPPIVAIEGLYVHLSKYLANFKTNWLEQLSLLGSVEKKAGREKEKEIFSKVIIFIEKMLSNSEQVRQNYSVEEIKKLSEFIFDNIMVMLRREETDFTFARNILTKLLN